MVSSKTRQPEHRVNSYHSLHRGGERNSFFFNKAIQPKLQIGTMGDGFEQEADAVADKVMRMPDNKKAFFKPAKNLVQKKCTDCEEDDYLQMKSDHTSGGSIAAPTVEHEAINSPGQPLDMETKHFMESKFGNDFENVRIHNDSLSHQSSADINALAYTYGNHIVFGEGQYNPTTNAGKNLLAHELTHVIQQKESTPNAPNQLSSGFIQTKRKPSTTVKVEIPKINAPNTPKGVNRIIPRKDLEVGIKITGASAASPVTLSVEGAGGGNGSAKINGAATYSMNASEKINLKGEDQTEPGNAGKLTLVAMQGSTVLKRSNVFSVAAYPISIGFNFSRLLEGNSIRELPDILLWGAAYSMKVDSDSGVLGDCNKTAISENVIVIKRAGFFKDMETETSKFQNSTRRQADNHAVGAETVEDIKESIEVADIPKSNYVAEQFFRFSCERTGIAPSLTKSPKVSESGFKITRKVGKNFFTTQKEGHKNHDVLPGVVDDTGIKKSFVT